jgi:hypothetical protein
MPMRPLASWRLFLGGSMWRAAAVAGLMSLVFVPMMLTFPRGGGRAFLMIGCAVWMQLVIGTWFIERLRGAQLAFMTLVPQRVPGQWLVLAPMCAAAVVAALVMTLLGLSVAGACLFLGCGLWAIGAVRWVGRSASWFWSWLPAPLVVVAPLVARAVYRAGGGQAAAATSMALGLGLLAFQPRAYLGPGLDKQAPGDGVGIAPRAASRQAVSGSAGERAVWLVSAIRFMNLSAPYSRLLTAMWLALGVLPLLLSGWAGQMIMLFVIALPTQAVSTVHSRESFEFLHPRPFTRGQQMVGGVVIPVAMALVMPAIAIAQIDLDWINAGGFIDRWLSKPGYAHQSTLDYLRDAVGATFLPEKWPAGGLTTAMWAQLRPLLWLDLLRLALLTLASLLCRPSGLSYATQRLGLATSMPLMFVTFACALRLSSGPEVLGPLPVPPLWFVALLFAAAVASWNLQRRLASAR